MISKSFRLLQNFFALEAAAGALLAMAALAALIVENSSLSSFYQSILNLPVHISLGSFAIEKPLLLWINDGLMALFFLLIGLEIKREALEGQLSTRAQLSLPAFAALGGLLCPVLIYIMMNKGDAIALQGWAIPAATDIAFALSILIVVGSRIPVSLKICLMAIAILDDLVSILIIALFYTETLSWLSLGISVGALSLLSILNRQHVKSIGPYMVVGVLLWACILKSGVHATLAGVILAFFIPLLPDKKNKNNPDYVSPSEKLEHGLHPWIAYGILPLFAFANAGVSLKGVGLDLLTHPITLGITLGLFFGKQIGVMAFTFLGDKMGICHLPRDVTWTQFYGMSLLTGVGFTMSLFIGTLAFDDPEILQSVRLGVLCGSLIAGLMGYCVLLKTSKKS